MAQTLKVEDIQFPSFQQLLREGRAIQANMPIITTANTGTVNFGASLGAITYNSTPGRATLITSVTASATGMVQAYGSSSNISKNLGANLLGQVPTTMNAVFGSNGGSATLNPMVLLGSEGKYDLNFRYIGADGGAKPYVGGGIYGIDFTADYNFDARKVIGIIGESTSWSSMETDPNGVTWPGEYLWGFQVNNMMRRLGKSVRLVNKAYGSMSSNHMEFSRRSNYYDFDYDLLFVNMGINDSIAANSGLGVITPEATFKANMSKIIAMRNNFRPNAPIVFVSCFPTDAASPNVANTRTWMQQVATDPSQGGGTENNVWFIDGNAAFNLNPIATDDTNFAVSNRSSGNRIHYSGLGQSLNAQLVLNQIQNMAWFNGF